MQTKSMNGCRKQKDRGRKIKNETQTKEYRPDRLYGIGKTTLGLKLSYLADAGRRHGQADRETGEGRSITQIFADDGESYFRELETELLRKCGGTEIRTCPVCGRRHSGQSGEPAPAHQCGTVVYLRVSPGSGLRAAEK